MRLLALLLLALTLTTASSAEGGLPQEEIDALRILLETWPNLQDGLRGWNASHMEDACSVPFNGLTCSLPPNVHVTGMYGLVFSLPDFACPFWRLLLRHYLVPQHLVWKDSWWFHPKCYWRVPVPGYLVRAHLASLYSCLGLLMA